MGFLLLVAVAFAGLLPFAYSVARDIRRCRDHFPQDLAIFEQLLRSGDFQAVYANSSAALRRTVTLEQFLSQKDRFVPEQASYLQSVGEYSAFGWQAEWKDDRAEPITEPRFQFWWEDGRHKLHRVPGIVEPTRERVVK